MLAIERDGGTLNVDMLQFIMPPSVASFFHLDLVVRALEHYHSLDGRASAKRLVDVSL